MSNLIKDLLTPEQGRLLDNQLRQQKLNQGVTNYGSDAIGKLLTSVSGAQRASAGFGMLGERLMGGRQKGVNEMQAVQAQQLKQAEQAEKLKQTQNRTGEAARLVNQDLQRQLKNASPEEAKQLKQKAANTIRNVAMGNIDAEGVITGLLDKEPEKPKDITGTIQAINASGISKDQKASLIRLTASGNISSAEVLDNISSITRENRESAGKWKSAGGDGSVIVNDVTGEERTIKQVNTGRDTSLTQDKIAKLYEKFTKDSIAAFIDDPKAPLISLGENKKDTFDYDEANSVLSELDRKSTSLSNLAYRIGEADLKGGIRGSVTEFVKEKAGMQDIETEVRKEYDLVVKSGMLKYLPPGVASDKDVALVLQGLPDTFANGETARRYIMGMAKLQRQQAKYQKERIAYARDNSGDMSGFLDSQKNKAIKEYRGSFDQLAVADPNVQKAYDNAKYLLSLGIDPIEVEQRTFNLFSKYPDLGVRNATLVNELIKLEGY